VKRAFEEKMNEKKEFSPMKKKFKID